MILRDQRGYPNEMLGDNGSQLVGTRNKLQLRTEGLKIKQLKHFCAERGMKWRFTAPAGPHQISCTEAVHS